MRISHITFSLLIIILNSNIGWGYDFISFPKERPGYLGAVGCQTSMCHGGAAPMTKQYTIWKQKGPHSKSYATLTTAWSKRIADTLKIENPTTHPDCTMCHAPLAQVDPARLASPDLIREGVSCASCHGPSSEWIQSHTRLDYSHQQRVATGLVDQENLYIRADTCVACHQQIDSSILEAGHPPLEYDLVGLQQRMPRHWQETWPEAQAWLVGQATSLREAAYVYQLWQSKAPAPTRSKQSNSQIDLLMTLARSLELSTDTSALQPGQTRNWEQISRTADELAEELSQLPWSPEIESKAENALRQNADSDNCQPLTERFLQLTTQK